MTGSAETVWGISPSAHATAVPLSTFVLKLAGRCNLDCDYCYVYHSADSSWKRKPKLMSNRIVDQTLDRIVEHVRTHAVKSVSIVLHGGEPLLAGVDAVEYVFRRATELLGEITYLELSIQSNATLLSEEMVDLLVRYDARIGVSIDGFKEANAHRTFRDGRSSFEDTERGILLLESSEGGRRVLSGFLAVIDPAMDPIAVFEYLAQHRPKSIDFLLPYATHDKYPKGKGSFADTTYGDWLIAVFDHWFDHPEYSFRLKYFDNIIALLVGGQSETECLGHPPVNIVTVETNGDIEALDCLKVAFEGAPFIGLNVHSSSFDEAVTHPALLSRMQGVATLGPECRRCPLVDICGGGYLPHRYSTQGGFLNPSVFCHDIAKLVIHIRQSILSRLRRVV